MAREKAQAEAPQQAPAPSAVERQRSRRKQPVASAPATRFDLDAVSRPSNGVAGRAGAAAAMQRTIGNARLDDLSGGSSNGVATGSAANGSEAFVAQLFTPDRYALLAPANGAGGSTPAENGQSGNGSKAPAPAGVDRTPAGQRPAGAGLDNRMVESPLNASSVGLDDASQAAGTPPPDVTPADDATEPEFARSVELVSPEANAQASPVEPQAQEAQVPDAENPIASEVGTQSEQEGTSLPEAPPEGDLLVEGIAASELDSSLGLKSDSDAESGGAAVAEGSPAAASDAPANLGVDTPDVGGPLVRLANASSSASALTSSPVRFVSQPDESSRELDVADASRQQRAAAEALATGFLSSNAGLAQTLIATGEGVPARIAAAAEVAKSAINAAVARNQAIVTTAIATGRGEAEAHAVAAHRQVAALHAATTPEIASATTAAREHIESARADAGAKLDELERTQTERIATLYTTNDAIFRAVGPKVGAEAVAIGTTREQAYLAQRNGESSILDGPIHDNRMEARAEAAVSVAAEYRKSLIVEAEKQATAAQAGKAKDLAAVGEAAGASRKALADQADAAGEALDRAERKALAAADDAMTSLDHAIDQNLASTLDVLAGQETSQVEALQQYGEQQKALIDHDAAIAIQSLVAGSAEAALTLTGALEAFVASAIDSPPPEQTALEGALGAAQRTIDALAADLLAHLEEGIALAEQTTVNAGNTSASGIDTLGQGGTEQVRGGVDTFATSVSSLVDAASETLSQLQRDHAETSTGTVTTAQEGFTSAAAGIETLFTTIAGNLEKGFTEAAKGLEEGLRGSLKGLDAEITKYAEEAAAKVQPRWKTIVKWALIIAVVLVVTFVVGPAVIGFVGGVAAGLGAGATAATFIGAIVGGAIVGAAANATIQIGNNLIDGEKAFKGVGKALVVGAISGAVGGFGGALAQGFGNAFSASLGRVSLTIGKEAISQLFGVAGGIAGDLIVGNPVTLTSVLIGATVGLVASGLASRVPKLGAMATRIQSGSEAAGQAVGARIISRPAPVVPTAPTSVAPQRPTETAAPEAQPAPTADQPSVSAAEQAPAAEPIAAVAEPAVTEPTGGLAVEPTQSAVTEIAPVPESAPSVEASPVSEPTSSVDTPPTLESATVPETGAAPEPAPSAEAASTPEPVPTTEGVPATEEPPSLTSESPPATAPQEPLAEPGPSSLTEQPLAEPLPGQTLEEVTTQAADTGSQVSELAGPGSPQHKASRWKAYLERGGKWTYKRWSNVYESNMVQANRANAAVDAYHAEISWGQREVTVDVEGVPRRLDIADEATLRGIEHKTGRQGLSKSNDWEIARDQILRQKGWNIQWVFEGTASPRLQRALTDAGIPFIIR